MNGAFDRDKARDALIWMQENGGLDMYGWDDCLNRLSECVSPDRRIGQISALCKAGEAYGYVRIDALRDVLRGGS